MGLSGLQGGPRGAKVAQREPQETVEVSSSSLWRCLGEPSGLLASFWMVFACQSIPNGASSVGSDLQEPIKTTRVTKLRYESK